MIYEQSAPWYDRLYAFKDYAGEAARVTELIRQRGRPGGRRLLDAACGTGRHITGFRHDFDVEGLDIDSGMLAVARARHPDLVFHQADLADFDLGVRYDAIVCLCSSIGYMVGHERLTAALRSFRRHLEPGGVAIVEPWLLPDVWIPGKPYLQVVDEPELKVARISCGRRDGEISVLDFHITVGTPEGARYIREEHRLQLYTVAEYLAAFEAAGLAVEHDPAGLGRGLFIGRAPGPSPGGGPS